MANSVRCLLFFLSTVTLIGFSQQQLSNQTGGCDCGTANRRTRIVNGSATEVGEYPWMVDIYKVTRDANNFKNIIAKLSACGGALISQKYVLTAAHCVYRANASQFVADIGDYDLSKTTEAANIYVDVITIIGHPGYNITSHANDVALLELAISIVYTSNIKPICIPPLGLNVELQKLVVAGWGTTSNNGNSSDILLEVTLPVISNQQCKAFYNNSNAVIDNSVCCTQYTPGSTPQDACQGDSGGPAVLECSGRFLIAGIISYSIGCANAPGVYTNVSYYRDWIVANTPPFTLCGYDCKPAPPIVEAACGWKNEPIGRRKRVIGGITTQPNEFPWMAAIYIFNKIGNVMDFTCGATVISQNWVITAAKCVFGIGNADIQVVLGDYDDSVIETGEVEFGVAQTIIYPNYDSNLLTNNIALIKLDGTAIFGRYIYPICLSTPSSVPATFTPGTQLTFIGWGVDQSNSWPAKLKEVNLTTISNTDCYYSYGSIVDSSTVCTASSATSGVCLGDRGGPLMQTDTDGRYFEVALQSFRSNAACTSTIPAGNLEIAPFMSWIISNTGVQPVTPNGALN